MEKFMDQLKKPFEDVDKAIQAEQEQLAQAQQNEVKAMELEQAMELRGQISRHQERLQWLQEKREDLFAANDASAIWQELKSQSRALEDGRANRTAKAYKQAVKHLQSALELVIELNDIMSSERDRAGAIRRELQQYVAPELFRRVETQRLFDPPHGVSTERIIGMIRYLENTYEKGGN